jgi:hypothetical protein
MLLLCLLSPQTAPAAAIPPEALTATLRYEPCAGTTTVPALVTVRVADLEDFVVRVTDQDVLDTMIEICLGLHGPMNVTGDLLTGNQGYNHDALSGSYWSWHLDEDTVALADMSMEICDGRPSFVDGDLHFWLTFVGHYCPWSCDIVAIDADTALLGDINVDGVVDAGDLAILASSLTRPNVACCGGMRGNYCAADTDADTDVDLHDFATLQQAGAR